jgi:hypothetical protein
MVPGRAGGDPVSWTELMPGGPATPPADPVSWTDMMTPWAAEPAPVLRLRDYLSRRSDGFCADCLQAGGTCPDHQQDSAGSCSRPSEELT